MDGGMEPPTEPKDQKGDLYSNVPTPEKEEREKNVWKNGRIGERKRKKKRTKETEKKTKEKEVEREFTVEPH